MTATITLSGAMLAPLRSALYSRLSEGIDTVDTALNDPNTEQNLDVRTAYLELRATGALLDRLGWRRQEALDVIGEARLVIDALTTELETEASSVGTARGFGEDHAALAAERRWQAVHTALWQIEAATAAATTDGDSAGDAKG